MKLHIFSVLLSAAEFVGAGPRLLFRAQDKQCSAKWVSTVYQTNKISSGNCMYSDSQDNCGQGLSMAVDEKICPWGKLTLRFSPFLLEFLQLANQNRSRQS